MNNKKDVLESVNNVTKDLTDQICALDDESKNEIIKMAIEGKMKLDEKMAYDEIKSKNADIDFERHIQAVRLLDSRDARGMSRIQSDIETPSGKMSIQSHSSKCYVATATYENQFHENVVI